MLFFFCCVLRLCLLVYLLCSRQTNTSCHRKIESARNCMRFGHQQTKPSAMYFLPSALLSSFFVMVRSRSREKRCQVFGGKGAVCGPLDQMSSPSRVNSDVIDMIVISCALCSTVQLLRL
jgi:hypothetical protein